MADAISGGEQPAQDAGLGGVGLSPDNRLPVQPGASLLEVFPTDDHAAQSHIQGEKQSCQQEQWRPDLARLWHKG
jgi:hypothetical protein